MCVKVNGQIRQLLSSKVGLMGTETGKMNELKFKLLNNQVLFVLQ